jgi:nucleotide-binding universal stress UspA family protein
VTVVVGVARAERGSGCVQLAAMLARSADEDLVVATAVPAPWPAGMARVDAEYQAYLDKTAQAALDAARGALEPDLPASFTAVRARSVPAGLLQVAEGHDTSVLVVGSSAAGPLGRVALGSVADRLLHTSPVPVGLAPRGFRPRPGARVGRVTVAYGATGALEQDLVVGAGGVAARVGAALRVASFAVRPGPVVTAGVGLRAEDEVLDEWAAHIRRAQQEMVEQVLALPVAPEPGGTVIGRGYDWDEALADVEWDDGDVLVVGSSPSGPLARVFLGSRASKIVRNAPVPVVAVPRGAAEELAEDAERAEPVTGPGPAAGG